MDRFGRVMSTDREIMPEQFDGRQVGRGRAESCGIGFENKPFRRVVRMYEFVDQARLAHSRLADDRHNLTATAAGKLLGANELLHLDIAADEAGKTTPG